MNDLCNSHYITDVKRSPVDYDIKDIDFDKIYAAQDVKAFNWFVQHIGDRQYFVDIGSKFHTILMLSCIRKCKYVEFRAPTIKRFLGIEFVRSEGQRLPFQDSSIPFITSLHAIEHFGLGRYGDPIDASGDIRALGEFYRALEPGGICILSIPTNNQKKSYCEFNNQRVYTKALFDKMLTDTGFSIKDWVICFYADLSEDLNYTYANDIRVVTGASDSMRFAYMTLCKKPA